MLKFEEQFPEAIDLLARALRAGHALTTGLSMVAEELPAANRARNFSRCTTSRTSVSRSHRRCGTLPSAFLRWMRGSS